MSTLRERLIEAREEAKLSQQQLADLAHCGQTTVVSIENGRNKGATPLVMLAHVLRVNPLWLVEGMGPKRSKGATPFLVTATTVTDDEERLILAAYRSADKRMREVMIASAKQVLESFGQRSQNQN